MYLDVASLALWHIQAFNLKHFRLRGDYISSKTITHSLH